MLVFAVVLAVAAFQKAAAHCNGCYFEDFKFEPCQEEFTYMDISCEHLQVNDDCEMELKCSRRGLKTAVTSAQFRISGVAGGMDLKYDVEELCEFLKEKAKDDSNFAATLMKYGLDDATCENQELLDIKPIEKKVALSDESKTRWGKLPGAFNITFEYTNINGDPEAKDCGRMTGFIKCERQGRKPKI